MRSPDLASVLVRDYDSLKVESFSYCQWYICVDVRIGMEGLAGCMW